MNTGFYALILMNNTIIYPILWKREEVQQVEVQQQLLVQSLELQKQVLHHEPWMYLVKMKKYVSPILKHIRY